MEYIASRRHFLKYLLSTSAMTLTSVNSHSAETDLAYIHREEQRKAAKAKYTFNFASPYLTSAAQYTPHVHQEIKQIIEQYTNNNIYVNIIDNGKAGVGSSLISSVKFGRLQGALISVSNLSPQINAIDILNIPFWASDDDAYLRVVNSPLWHEKVLSQASKFNLKVLFHYVVGKRTAASTKFANTLIASPDDYQDIEVRVANSKVNLAYYKQAKAVPYPIAWKLCAAAARAGRFKILDPSIIGLFSGPDNLKNEIDTISQIGFAQDGWMAIANQAFIELLDNKVKKQFNQALADIQILQYQHYLKAHQACIDKFQSLGTHIYTPDKREKQLFIERFGHQHRNWRPTKRALLGENGLALFDKFYEIAQGI